MGRFTRIPILMIVLGFGSLILKQFNYHFTLLAWADDYQPAAGAIIGLLGVVILLLIAARARSANSSTGEAGYGRPQPGQGMQPGANFGGPAGPAPGAPGAPGLPGGPGGPGGQSGPGGPGAPRG